MLLCLFALLLGILTMSTITHCEIIQIIVEAYGINQMFFSKHKTTVHPPDVLKRDLKNVSIM